ncbi:MAG: 30S ribosomal protein S19 [Candidatus Diapherotrites archaeon]|uniref:Small ribosomal subunit protein uS19 n=1 Tax=Candidatus Iainarchaeum sp. TaxID=3101447 RepID=A0A8T5GEJ4_9ARCH|nr:30S ribosomal protein S19 [Candidatus Diapherotrites archaeon]
MELRKKDFTYRGKTVEELKQLNVREFSKYLCSRERRAVNRQFHKIEEFVERAKQKEAKGKKIRTHQRDLIIVPELVGLTIYVYDGQNFAQIQIKGEMVGHKFGEYAPTRRKVAHGSAGVGATKGSKFKSKK